MPAERRKILLILAKLTLELKLISQLIGTMDIIFLLQTMVLLHYTMVLLGLLLQSILVIFHYAYNFLTDSRRKSESQLVCKTVSAPGRYSERIESELFIIMLMTFLEGDGADSKREGGLFEAPLIAIHGCIVVNRHI